MSDEREPELACRLNEFFDDLYNNKSFITTDDTSSFGLLAEFLKANGEKFIWEGKKCQFTKRWSLTINGSYSVFELNGKNYWHVINADTGAEVIFPSSNSEVKSQLVQKHESGFGKFLKFLGGAFAAGAAAQVGSRMVSNSYSNLPNQQRGSRIENPKWSQVTFNDGITRMIPGEVVRTTLDSVIVKQGSHWNVEYDSRGNAKLHPSNQIDLRR